jgi:SAM-dependent methyltransferase
VLFEEPPPLPPCELAEPSGSSEDLALGRVYTPAHLVDFVLDLSGFGGADDQVTVLDPACGPGAFLVGAVKRLALSATQEGATLESASAHGALARRVEATVFGIDVDPVACFEARQAVRRTVQQLSPGPLPNDFFEANVRLADFLLDGEVDTLCPAQGFDYVVGNPPYVATTRIPSGYKDVLRRRFSTATGRLDLYTLFMERAVELLRPGGRLSFITPNKYLASHSAGLLRELLMLRGRIVRLANFSSHKVFDDAATVPCVTVFELGSATGETEVLECGDQPDARGVLPVLSRSAVAIAPGRGTWHVGQPALHSLAQRMGKRQLPLAAFVSRVSAGIATGRDAIFVRPAAELDVEPELLRPAVRGRDLAPHRIAASNLAIVLPYRFPKGAPELINLDEYPRARAHLARYEKELRERHCVRAWGKAWWDLHDPVGCDLARLQKILVPDVAASNRFALDDGRHCPLHSAYYIVPRSIDGHYLVALLNSKPIEFMIRLCAPVVKDGFSRYRKQFLMQIPIPTAEGDAHRAMIAAALTADTDVADEIAAELFELTSSELRAIDDYLQQRAEARRALPMG